MNALTAMKKTLTLAALTGAAALPCAYAAGADAMKPLPAAQACVACHGTDGNSSNAALYPNLAGQAPAYITLQLANFKSGERPQPVMKAIADTLNPQQMRELGVYFGAMHAKPQVPRDKALEARGRQIFTGGNAAAAPACIGCHGAQGHGQGEFPRIASQPAPYLLEQLYTYRDVPAFQNPLATMMKGVAMRLSEADMRALSAYVATLP